jgi:prevent-host-death family protein
MMMKTLQVADDILPLGEFKTQASRVIRRLRADKRPIVITQNGKPAAVLLAPEDFDRLQERGRFMEAVREGLADSNAGRLIDDSTLGRELDAALGPVKRRTKSRRGFGPQASGFEVRSESPEVRSLRSEVHFESTT